MKICVLAIALMWISTLRTAVYIASFAIQVPLFETVISSWESAISLTLEEKDKFSTCASNQIDQCYNNLEEAIRLEDQRVNNATLFNVDLLENFQSVTSICIDDYTSLKRAVEGCVNELQEIPIKDEQCTPEERKQMMSAVGDVKVLKAETLAISAEFKQHSEMTVNRCKPEPKTYEIPI